jgi:hypothetical protein
VDYLRGHESIRRIFPDFDWCVLMVDVSIPAGAAPLTLYHPVSGGTADYPRRPAMSQDLRRQTDWLARSGYLAALRNES